MTDLPTRLRELAELQAHPLNQATLREAADALEERHKLACTNARMVEAAWQERDALKAKLDDAKLGEAKAWQRVHELTAKLAEAETSRAEATRVRDRSDHYALAERARAEKVEAEAAALREALTWYADADNHEGLAQLGGGSMALLDGGKKAREALSQPGPGAALLADAGRWRAFSADCTCGAARLHSSLFDTEKEKP